jgi:CubicO group peptidase (beta-lactamase class C family)
MLRAMDTGALDELGRFLDEEEAADRFSGTVAIEHGGEIVFTGAYGHAHLGFGVRNRVDTRCNTASITKMVTAVAVLQLVEAGDLSLEATVAELLPDVAIGKADRMTVHHLLSHQSGLGDYWNERCQQRRSVLRTTADYLGLLDGDEPAFEPGSGTAYGNSGYVLLGAIVERTTGVDYYDHVRDTVCRPAGMADAEHVELDRIADVAHGYTYVEWQGPAHPDHRRDNLFQYPVRGSAATGLYASAPDLVRFGLALRAHRLLGEEAVRWMLADPMEAGGRGYGTQRIPYAKGTAVGHGGRAFGAATIFLVLPEVDVSVAILANYDRPADKRVFEALDALL